MPLNAPNLDDRRFEDILAEAKALIPRYAPAWTDYNESDPGIAMLELFAWMTEMVIYRLNQVPERNYVKFLEMVGITPTPARPAIAELTFALSRPDAVSVTVPQGTRVAAPNASGQPPLVFETDEPLIAIGAGLNAVQTFDGYSYTVQTTKNAAAGQWFYPFGPHANPGSALMLGFDAAASFPTDQVHLAAHVAGLGPLTPDHTCSFDLNAQPLAATVRWEYWDGKCWKRLVLDKDETRAFTRDGHIYFRSPGAAVQPATLGGVPDVLYWIRALLVSSAYDLTPQLTSILTNTVRATQAQTVNYEVAGGSNGTPNQAFALANSPVLTLQLEIDEGSGFLAWKQVDDFYASGPNDAHYTLDPNSGQITFGDGQHGRIPLANPSNPSSNIVARSYRWGGGAAGNAAANTIIELQTYLSGVQSVTNLLPASGGTDEETVDQAKARAPREIKARNRAVTAEDFEFLAQQTPGVLIERSRAIPLMHPKFPGVQVPGAVTVVVVPDSDEPNPTPSRVTLEIVCAYLNAHRLLTSEVYVVAPVYRQVKVSATISVRPQADLQQVQEAVEAALTNFFHPLKGGADGTGWPFGAAIFYSDVMQVVLGTPGVSRVLNGILAVTLDGKQQPACQDVAICDGQLLYSNGHDISVSYATR
ncbi:MAG TPA: putative baseplate assembly protein [Bryobacteraceae bacterium]|nr:putative baseplate assembly protein [Bryobacteraceae bacterium]